MSFYFGIQITNFSPTPIRINWLGSVSPGLLDADGTALKLQGGGDIFIAQTKQSTCPLIMPGKSVSLFMENMVLYWQNGLLKFGSGTGYSGSWYFEGLKPGTYSVRLSYYNREIRNLCIDPATRK